MSSGRKRVKRKNFKSSDEAEMEKSVNRAKNTTASASKEHLRIEEVEELDDDFQSRINEFDDPTHQASYDDSDSITQITLLSASQHVHVTFYPTNLPTFDTL